MTDTPNTDVIDDTDVIDLPELDESWSATDMRQHMIEYHNSDSYSMLSSYIPHPHGGFSKARKDQLIALHDKLHEMAADDPEQNRGRKSTYFMRIEHEHGDVVEAIIDGPDSETRASQSPGSTPRLNSTERRTLEKLVDYDFASLKGEIDQIASDTLQSRLEALDDEFKEQQVKADKYAVKYKQMAEKHNAGINELIEQARAEGIAVTGTGMALNTTITCTIVDRAEKVARLQEENKRDKERAQRTLERKRLETQRTVLLTGLGTNAEAVLKAIPSAQELMIAAAQERAQLKELMA